MALKHCRRDGLVIRTSLWFARLNREFRGGPIVTCDQKGFTTPMWLEPIDSSEFLAVVGPALHNGSADEVARRVTQRWTPQQVCRLLDHQNLDVRKVACVVLGLVGTMDEAHCLGASLRDGDLEVSRLAEQALWSIFFRSGTDEAMPAFKQGLAAMEANDPRRAVAHFHEAHQIDPNFAEAYNQCGIAHYMLDAYDAARESCRQAVALVPIHFGALAGLGHSCAQLGDFAGAARAYKQALAVNPHMEGIAAVLSRVQQCVSGSQRR